jgi:hypothetical protein
VAAMRWNIHCGQCDDVGTQERDPLTVHLVQCFGVLSAVRICALVSPKSIKSRARGRKAVCVSKHSSHKVHPADNVSALWTYGEPFVALGRGGVWEGREGNPWASLSNADSQWLKDRSDDHALQEPIL